MNIKQAMKLVAKATALAANGSGNCAPAATSHNGIFKTPNAA